MVILLMMTGITLLGVTTIWLIEHANQRGVAGWRLLLPFGAGSYVREYWQDVRWFALARVLGAVMVLTGAGVYLAQNPQLLTDPDQFWKTNDVVATEGSTQAGVSEFLVLKQQAALAIRGDDKRQLSGKVHGQPFVYERVELVGGVLDMREGTNFLPLREVRVLIDLDPTGMTERRSFYVQPTDQNPPQVFVSWQDKAGALQTQIVKRGYSMELQLAPLDDYRLNGYVQLILPGQPASFLAGNFVAMTNHLRFVKGNVDITYDDPDTLRYVTRDYLKSQYQQGALRSVLVDDVSMDLDSGKGTATARVRLSNDQLEEHQLALQRDDMGWQVVSGSDQSKVLQAGVEVVPAQDEVTPSKAPLPKRIAPEDLVNLVGTSVTLVRSDGSIESGVVRGFDHRGLQIEEQMAGGSVQFRLEPSTIREIRLAGGRVLVLDQAQMQSATVSSDAAATLPVQAEQQAAAAKEKDVVASGTGTDVQASPDSAELARYKQWLNKPVSITGTDGRVRQGLLSGVSSEQLTLTVAMGAGSVQFYYKPSELLSVAPLKN